VFALFGASAQSAEYMDALAQADHVTVGQAAYLAAAASGQIDADADEVAAFDFVRSAGWLPLDAAMDAPVRVDDYSYALMRAFNLTGGLWYSWFPGPRYAYRHLVYSRVLQGRSDPGSTLSGVLALTMVGRAADEAGVRE
ncbi:MAG: hypothetical protein JXM71_02645, partial [Spirochaetales bacterium]|nr:hypothetical protein [Spirochaetales bacterium]